METQSIWRLEDEEGRGLYAGILSSFFGPSYFTMAVEDCGGISDEEDQKMCALHTAPFEDVGLGWDELGRTQLDYIFGFKNLAQFRRWIYREDWRRKLGEYGIRLNHYECDPDYCRCGQSQAIFQREHAVLIESVLPDLIH